MPIKSGNIKKTVDFTVEEESGEEVHVQFSYVDDIGDAITFFDGDGDVAAIISASMCGDIVDFLRSEGYMESPKGAEQTSRESKPEPKSETPESDDDYDLESLIGGQGPSEEEVINDISEHESNKSDRYELPHNMEVADTDPMQSFASESDGPKDGGGSGQKTTTKNSISKGDDLPEDERQKILEERARAKQRAEQNGKKKSIKKAEGGEE